MMTRLTRRIGFAAAIAASVVFVSSSITKAKEKEEVQLGAALSPEMLLPILVAKRDGCFDRHSINLTILPFAGTQTRDALASGQTKFALFHVAPVWVANLKGLPFKFVSMYYTKEIFGMLVNSNIKPAISGIAALKGLRGLTTVPGAAPQAATVFFLRQSGLDPARDVEMVHVASTDPKIWLNAIETNNVRFLGGVWEPVFTTATKSGIATSVFDPANADAHNKMYGGDVSTLGLVTTAGIIESNPELVQKMVDCVDEGLKGIPNKTDLDLAEVLKTEGGMKIDITYLVDVIQRIKGNFQKDGKPSEENYTRAVDAYIKAGYLQKRVPFAEIVQPKFVTATRSKLP